MTIATHMTEIKVWMMFIVANSKITNAKTIAIVIPRIALSTNAVSVGIHAQIPAACISDFIPSGQSGYSFLAVTHFYHISYFGIFMLVGSQP